jgi:hypothetical protein
MKHKRLVRGATFCITLMLGASPAWAEVMDKEPSVGCIWLIGLLSGCLGLLSARYCAWLVVGTLLLGSLLLGGVFSEIYDPYVGQAIRQEAGNAYILSAYGALGLALTLHLAGFRWRNRDKNRPQRARTGNQKDL